MSGQAKVSYATCHLCEAHCGIAVEHEEGRVLKVRGDEQDPLSRGYICPKATALGDVSADPDRVRNPQRRVGDRWVDIGWDEALDLVATRIAEIQAAHGKDAVGVFAGNPTLHSHGAMLFGPILLRALGTRSFFTSNSVDGLPRLLVSYLVYGAQTVVPVPDLDRTDFLLILGANPAVSNGSVMTAPDVKRRLAAIRARGGEVVVVDPRRTETAELADQHHFVRPGTDALLLAAMVDTIFREGLAAPGRLASMVAGLDRIPALVAPFSAERVAPAVGMEAESIRALARGFARAPSAACYARLGTCVQEFGALGTWLVDVLNVVTGNLDRPGGAMFTLPAADLTSMSKKAGMAGSYGRWRSRVRGLPEFNGEIPVACLAEEIDTPGPGQVRALLTHAANPVRSAPNGRRVDRALAGLDFMVSIDIYRNETTRHAHVLLPTSFGLEKDSYGLMGNVFTVRNYARYSRAVVPAPPGVKEDWEIFAALAARLVSAGRGVGARFAAGLLSRAASVVTPRTLLAAALRFGPHRLSLDKLASSEHGVDLGPLAPRMPDILETASRKIELTPAPVVADLGRLESKLGASRPELVLIGRRHLRSNNSWLHNSERMVTGKPRCTLLVNPADAAALGVSDGAPAAVSSSAGTLEATVEVSDEVMPGVVSLPHGFGQAVSGVQLTVATRVPGASVNDITLDTAVDAVSGASALNGVPVRVTPLR